MYTQSSIYRNVYIEHDLYIGSESNNYAILCYGNVIVLHYSYLQ